jgi:hypothetical protein
MPAYRLAALCVITAACSSSESPPKPPRPELVLYEIREHARGACVATVVCPPSTACTPRAPYAFPCDEDGTYQTISNRRVEVRTGSGEDDVRTEMTDVIAELPNGTCYQRKDTCTAKACLGERTKCPPDGPIAIRPSAWRIVEDGDTCRAVPLPATPVSEPAPAVAYPCPTDRSTGIRRDGKQCVADSWVGRPPRDDSRLLSMPIRDVKPCPE